MHQLQNFPAGVALNDSHEIGDRSADAKTTGVPGFTRLKALAFPDTFPMTVTVLAGRISSPRQTGAGPKKVQNARPAGQYQPTITP